MPLQLQKQLKRCFGWDGEAVWFLCASSSLLGTWSHCDKCSGLVLYHAERGETIKKV